ncbi:glucarate/galactarate transporter [Neoasaia chiangmaiensis NBRC 101099]|uniref:Glucarate transporter n=1 Tax=Neoasaia chiangmaiensis TaxID=320497 RepID=A0A1U9KNV4_9PROT|nr:MFS transporter [Neoasaia chiangmaiensis]AQS87476.1 glucarate transporter [Neoasaia chiangmaiensis]GBR42563.1 glucarate/galactarate transporter [Neoasaia chiangmaiensis NBRC 101099]GEN16269.1 MFS transporter [Neoasaia chiangmaiensis]
MRDLPVLPAQPLRFRYVIYTLTVLMSVICYADRAALSVGMPVIARVFALSPSQIGWVLSSFLWSYFILNLPGAMLLDRFGARRVGTWAVAFWSIAMMLGGMVTTLPLFLVTRVMLGAGEAPTFPLGNKVARAWAPDHERGIMLTALICGLPVGLAAGSVAGAWLITHIGWRAAFLALGGVGLAWSWIWWRAYPRDAAAPGGTTRRILSIRRIFGAAPFWGIVVGQCCANYANFLLMSWLPIILKQVLKLSLLETGVWTAICYLVSAALGLMLGRLGERAMRQQDLRHGTRRWVVGSYFLMATSMGFLPLCQSLPSVIALLAIAMAFLMAGIGANMALLSDLIVEEDLVASTTGLSFTFSNGAGIAAPVVTGYLLQATGNFHGVFYLTAAILLLGVLSIVLLPRRRFHAC